MKIFPDKRLIALSLIMTIMPVGNLYPTPQRSNGSVDIGLIAMISGLVVTSAIAGAFLRYVWECDDSSKYAFYHFHNKENKIFVNKDCGLNFQLINDEDKKFVRLDVASGAIILNSSSMIDASGKLDREFSGVFETKTGRKVHYKSQYAVGGFNCANRNKSCWCLEDSEGLE